MAERNPPLILVMHFKTVFSQHTTALSAKLIIILIKTVYGFQDMLTGKTMPVFVRLIRWANFRVDRTPLHRGNVLVTLIQESRACTVDFDIPLHGMLYLVIEMSLIRMPVMKFERYCVRPPCLGLRRDIILDFPSFLVE